MQVRMIRFTRRRIWLVPLVLLLLPVVLIVRPTAHLVRTSLNDQTRLEPERPGIANDASRLNPTAIAEIWPIPPEVHVAEEQLLRLLDRARREHLPISIAGARHSMGGHTVSPGGIVIDMLPFNRMTFDEPTAILHVQAGARWSQIIPYLDRRGWSVLVMQSNDSFSVGGSISVNCHGWQQNHAPIASSVASFRLLKADGTIVRCSRDENRELFSLVLGGYGLFGVILDVDLHVIPNQRYRARRYTIAADEYVSTYDREVNRASDVGMVFGRLSVAPESFLEEAILTVFHNAPSADGKLPPLTDPERTQLKRAIFRGSEGSEYGKHLRWQAEKKLQQLGEREYFSRNQLLNESVEIFANRSPETTDILHEYFVPPDQFNPFLRRVREIVPRHHGDLLNVTVRNVHADTDTFLRYADQEMFALVMLFVQARSPAGEKQMSAMTRELIDAVLACGGRYYLPYRLHATAEQFERAYPQARAFFELKRRYDPDELFQNQFYLKYGRAAAPSPHDESTAR
jgi:FAD/FMN-containing dehydrogenase